MSLRRRRLPAERMVWLVIGLALFRNEPIWHIVQQRDLAIFNRAYFSAAFRQFWRTTNRSIDHLQRNGIA